MTKAKLVNGLILHTSPFSIERKKIQVRTKVDGKGKSLSLAAGNTMYMINLDEVREMIRMVDDEDLRWNK